MPVLSGKGKTGSASEKSISCYGVRGVLWTSKENIVNGYAVQEGYHGLVWLSKLTNAEMKELCKMVIREGKELKVIEACKNLMFEIEDLQG